MDCVLRKYVRYPLEITLGEKWTNEVDITKRRGSPILSINWNNKTQKETLTEERNIGKTTPTTTTTYRHIVW